MRENRLKNDSVLRLQAGSRKEEEKREEEKMRMSKKWRIFPLWRTSVEEEETKELG